MIYKLIALGAVTVSAVLAAPNSGLAQEYLSGMKWDEPKVVTPGKTSADPPSDAIILLGKDLSAWENGDKWPVKDGVATIGTGKGDITTKQKFGDCQLHVEWSSPTPPKGHSQQRGNSGIFLQDRYEVQVLDSYKDETYFDGQASAIYKQRPPMVNAMRPPGEWNTYDIIWNAPKFKEDGSLESPGYVTVLHNGVLTQNHFAVEGATPFNQAPKYEKHGKLPIHLQDHGNPVRYRNIWVREIKPIEGTRERPPFFHDHATNKDTPVSEISTKVEGQLTFNGKAVQGGRIMLWGENAKRQVQGRVKDGKYEIDHVKPGKYAVAVLPVAGSKDDAKLPERYRTAEQSGLSVEVKDGTNNIDIALSAK
jgi:Domain of Unknown Function (DUF1080)